MHKWIRWLAISLAIVMVVSAIGAGAVLGADNPAQPPKSPAQAQPPPQQIYFTKLAARLNVTVDQLKAAVVQATTDIINELQTQGKITEQQKQQLLQRLQQWQGNTGTAIKLHFAFGPPIRGVTPDQLLAKLAARLNTTVDKLKAAIKDASIDTVNELAAQGKMTEQQKQQAIQRIQNGQIGPFGLGGMMPRPRGRMVPPRVGPANGKLFLDKLAARLGISRQQLDTAIGQAKSDVQAELKAQGKVPLPPRPMMPPRGGMMRPPPSPPAQGRPMPAPTPAPGTAKS